MKTELTHQPGRRKIGNPDIARSVGGGCAIMICLPLFALLALVISALIGMS